MIKARQGWRQGQTLFNFLWWLSAEKGIPTEYHSTGSRQADVFHIDDETLEKYWKEYLNG